MQFILGLSIAFMAMIYSVFHLKQDFQNYFDPVGFAVVLGGTLAVAVITIPFHQIQELLSSIKDLILPKTISDKTMNTICQNFVQQTQMGQPFIDQPSQSHFLFHQVLKDGHEMIQLGFKQDKIESILGERIQQWIERKQKIANALRSLSKYPPAFGLVGTVLGLVSLMRAISDGSSASETGLRMAVALVATLYGLLVSNLVLNPIGESILKSAATEKRSALMSLEAVLLIASEAHLLEAQETLNSYVQQKDRIQSIQSHFSENEVA